MAFKLRPYQERFVSKCVDAIKQHGNTLGVAPTGCHKEGTKILMFNGTFKNVEEVKVGDLLASPNYGEKREVLEKISGHGDMFEITTTKNEKFVVNGDHILRLVRTQKNCFYEISVYDYAKSSNNFKHLNKLYRPERVFIEEKQVILDPYFLGLFLGDGYSTKSEGTGVIGISNCKKTIIDHVNKVCESNKCRVISYKDNRSKSVSNSIISTSKKHFSNTIREKLKELGLFQKDAGTKFIPDCYKFNSEEVRGAVLAGLLDTDGYLHNNCFEYTTKSEKMFNDFVFVARSLGIFARIGKQKIVKEEIYYRCHLSGNLDKIKTKVKIANKRKQIKNALRTGIKSVRFIGKNNFYGFNLDGDKLYMTEDFIVHHNSGKTILLSSIIQRLGYKKNLVVVHRNEINKQNEDKFRRTFGDQFKTSFYGGGVKEGFDGEVVFGMIQTLSRQTTLDILPKFDTVTIDETHRLASDSYQTLIAKLKELNPDIKILGVTATPDRGDGKGLRPVLTNIAEIITAEELISEGFLVSPKTFVFDFNLKDEMLKAQTSGDFDQELIADLLDTADINSSVYRNWKEKAGNRKTILFCSTVKHAKHLKKVFDHFGEKTALVHGGQSEKERKENLDAFEKGDALCMFNVAVLTEGYDYPPTSCVCLLRVSSYRSTMIQMIGRGLRTVNPEEYPGVDKKDCIVLDFGITSLIHGTIEADVDLHGRQGNESLKEKICPDCGAVIRVNLEFCPICGYSFKKVRIKAESLKIPADFNMIEIDLMVKSKYLYEDIFEDGCLFVCSGFNASTILAKYKNTWNVFALKFNGRMEYKGKADTREIAFKYSNDWMNEYETGDKMKKSQKWLKSPATSTQLTKISQMDTRKSFKSDSMFDVPTKHRAGCLLTYLFNKNYVISTLRQTLGEPDGAE